MPFWPIVVWPQYQCYIAVLEWCSKWNGHLTPSGSTVVGFVPRWAFFLSNGIFSPVTNFLLELEFTKTNKTKTKIEKMFLKTIRFIILKVVLSAEVSRPDICLAATFARTPLYEKRRMALSDLVLRAALGLCSLTRIRTHDLWYAIQIFGARRQKIFIQLKIRVCRSEQLFLDISLIIPKSQRLSAH